MRKEFQVHKLNDGGIKKATTIAQAYSALLDIIEDLVPVSRERSLAVTALQESSSWAKRGIAMLVENQEK